MAENLPAPGYSGVVRSSINASAVASVISGTLKPGREAGGTRFVTSAEEDWPRILESLRRMAVA